jgi:Acyl-CoA dehydrogenase, N-terminal domain
MSATGSNPVSAKVISYSEATIPPLLHSLQTASRDVGDRAFAHAGMYDEDGAFPASDIVALHEAGLLTAHLPREFGGAALGGPTLGKVLRNIGWPSLPLGRLFEGHVNATSLVLRYGDREQIIRIASEARQGKLFGVWNTDDENNLRLIRSGRLVRLEGRKILASGAGHIERPIVTATDERERRLIVMPHLRSGERADLSRWTAHGMRASATGAVDFSGVVIAPDEIVGSDGDANPLPPAERGVLQLSTAAVLKDCLTFFVSISTKLAADMIRIRRRVSGKLPLQPKRQRSGWSAHRKSRKSRRKRSRPIKSLPTSISLVWRWSARIWISWSSSGDRSACKVSCVRIQSNAFLVTSRPIFDSRTPIAH